MAESAVTQLIAELNGIDEEKMNAEPYSCEQICKRAAVAMSLMQNELRALSAAPQKS